MPMNVDWFAAAVAFGSAIVGAGVGAVPTFVLARRGSQEVLRRDRQARTDTERAAGMRVHVKLGTIVNSVLTLKRQLDQALSRPEDQDMELWQRIEPVVGFAGEQNITFDADEVSVFLAAGASDYAEALLVLSRRHAVHSEVFRTYAELRSQLREAMPPPSGFEDNRASTNLSREEFMRVRPLMLGMNTLLEQAISNLAEDVDLAIALARDYGPLLREYFKDQRYPSFMVPSDPAALMAVRRYERRQSA